MKLGNRIFAAALCVALGIASLTGCGTSKIDGSKTVVTVNDEKVPLGVVSFLAKYQQAETYAMYSQYFGSTTMFDTVADSSTGSTYGDDLRSSTLTEIEDLVLVSQHASDYSVALTDEENTKIETIAQSYIDSNTEEVRNKVGASKDNVIKLLQLLTIKSDMLDPMAADVDTNVTTEESQQTSVSYVTVEMATDSDSSSTTSTSSGTDSVNPEEGMTTEQKNEYRLANAQKVLDAMKSQTDVAGADMTTVAQTVDSSYKATTGQFTTNNKTDTYLDSSIVEAVDGLKDGTMVDHVVTSSDSTKYYVVRLDKVNDTDKTASKAKSILAQRKSDNYDKMLADWRDASTITVDQDVLSSLKIADSDPVTVAVESTAADSTAASTATSTAASTETSTAASTETSTATSTAASTAASTASSAS